MLVFYLHTFNNKTSIIWQNTCINISICADIQCILDHCSACFFSVFPSSYHTALSKHTLSGSLDSLTVLVIIFSVTSGTIQYIFLTYIFTFMLHTLLQPAYCAHERGLLSYLLTHSCCFCTFLITSCFVYALLLWHASSTVAEESCNLRKKKTCKQTKLKQIKKTCSSV